jgi:hypothetical protein
MSIVTLGFEVGLEDIHPCTIVRTAGRKGPLLVILGYI